MADNVISNSGSGGATWATDECTVNSVLVHVPWCKLGYGTFDTFTAVTSSAGLPVAQQGTWNITNISGTVALPTGAATLAEQQTQTTALSAIQTAVQLLDNAISGSELQVDIVAALPAGTNNIGDVDVISVVPGTSATSLGKAEDAGHASGDTGVMSLAVRSDSDASLCGTDLDYTPLQVDANGYLKVNIKAGAGSGGTASTDDAAFTAASGSGTPMMGFVTADSVDAGDVGVVGMLANRQLKVTLYDSGGVELAVGGGTQYDEDTAHVSGDKLTLAGAVRRDTATSGASADGDRATLNVDGTGRLWSHDPVAVAVLTTIDADTGALAGCVGGTELQVDIVAALPAGTNNIGDVDVLSVVPGTGATNLGKAVDSVAGATDTGVAPLAVRDDALSTLTPVEGDYVPLRTDSTGAVWVNCATVASHAVTNAGTFAVQAAQSGTWNITNVSGTVSLPTGASTLAEQQTQTTALSAIQTATQLIDDSIVADDAAFTPATTKVMMAGFEFDDTTPDSVDEGDAGAARMSANRCQYVMLRDGAGNERGANINASNQLSVSVDNTVTVASHAVTNAGTFAVQATLAAGATTIAKAEDVASADADVGVPAMAVRKATPANTSGTDGDYEMLQMSAGRLWVDASGVTLTVASHAVTNAGTFAVQVDGSALTALQLIDDTVFADDAAFTVASSKVSAIGCLADETSTDSVDEGDVGIPRMTLARQQLVVAQAHTAGGATPAKLISAASNNATSVKASAGTLYSVSATNVNAAIRYLKFYNKASSPTVGTDTPVLVYGIPGNTAGAGHAVPIPACGINFDTGIALALVTGIADSDNTSVAANEIAISYSYK